MNNFTNYKNARIHFSAVGKGDVVVLLHGFLEDMSMWKKIQEELIKTNRVICIDLLGHGKSDCLGYVHTMKTMAKAVKFVLDELSINEAIFIGHSMGGYVALAFAELFQNVVKGICLMNSTAQEDTIERKINRDRAVKMAQKSYKQLVSMSINNLFYKETREEFLKEIEGSRNIAMQTTVQSYVACTEGMKLRKNRENVLINFDFKSLIIAGKKDHVLDYNLIVGEAERTNTKLITLSRGHMSHIENASELIIVLKEFVGN